MNRRISDLMDHIGETYVEVNMVTPLSSQRIKEITMRNVKKANSVRRGGMRLLFAAAIIAMLVVTAFAAENVFKAGDWFRGLFDEEISDGQVEVINDLGRVFEEQTQTNEGTTVIMHAAYGDAYVLHLYLSVEAPEGTVLPDDILYTFHDGNAEYAEDEERYRLLSPGKDAPYKTISQQIEIEALPDDDPGDNKKDFHVLVNGQAGTKCNFNDGYTKYFNISGIWQQIPNMNEDEDGYEMLASGTFSFEVGLTEAAEMIELKEAEGFVYGGEKSETWTHDSPCLNFCEQNLTGETDPETGLPVHSESWVYQVTVKKLSISPMSVEWEVEYTCDNDQLGCGLEFCVVMKDGSQVKAGAVGSRSDAPPWLTGGPGIGEGLNYFNVPIDLAEVDYILIGDEELEQTLKVYLPDAAE